MSASLVDEQIKILSKQLKIPTFANYSELIRRAAPDSNIGDILLMLMKAEYEQRQWNQNQRRLKQAGFPFTKTRPKSSIAFEAFIATSPKSTESSADDKF